MIGHIAWCAVHIVTMNQLLDTQDLRDLFLMRKSMPAWVVACPQWRLCFALTMKDTLNGVIA